MGGDPATFEKDKRGAGGALLPDVCKHDLLEKMLLHVAKVGIKL